MKEDIRRFVWKEIRMEKISNNVWVETNFFGANIGIIKTDVGLLLVDTPMNPSDQDYLINEIKELGAISWIITTDHHLDHFLGASFLPGTIVSHRAIKNKFLPTFGPIEKVVERVYWSDPANAERVRKLNVKEPSLTFDGRISFFYDPVVIHLEAFAGHTPHTVSVIVEPDGVLFTGDNVVNGPPFFLHDAEDPFAWIDSLNKMKELPFDILVPGHGSITSCKVLDRMADSIKGIIERVRDALNHGLSEEEILDTVHYLSAFEVSVKNSSQIEFQRELERRGITRVIHALKASFTDEV